MVRLRQATACIALADRQAGSQPVWLQLSHLVEQAEITPRRHPPVSLFLPSHRLPARPPLICPPELATGKLASRLYIKVGKKVAIPDGGVLSLSSPLSAVLYLLSYQPQPTPMQQIPQRWKAGRQAVRTVLSFSPTLTEGAACTANLLCLTDPAEYWVSQSMFLQPRSISALPAK